MYVSVFTGRAPRVARLPLTAYGPARPANLPPRSAFTLAVRGSAAIRGFSGVGYTSVNPTFTSYRPYVNVFTPGIGLELVYIPPPTAGDYCALLGARNTPAPLPAAPTPRPAVITVFSPATVRARLARRARGLAPTYYRVKAKRRVGPSARPPARYPARAALGVPRGYTLAA